MNMSTGKRTSIQEVELAILGSLAEGTKSFYDLVNHENIASPNTVMKVLNRLVNLSQIDKGDPEEKNRMPYRLTVYGIVRAFGESGVKFDVSKASDCYRDLFPLVFGKREFFEDEGVYIEVMRKFRSVTRELISWIEFLMSFYKEDFRHTIKSLLEGILQNEGSNKKSEQIKYYRKILESSEKELEEYKARDARLFYESKKMEIVEMVSQDTLFSFGWGYRAIRDNPRIHNIYSSVEASVKRDEQLLKIYSKDKELREFITIYFEKEMERNKAYFKAITMLNEKWQALTST